MAAAKIAVEFAGKNDKLAIKVYRCFCAALAERLRKANAKLAEVGHH